MRVIHRLAAACLSAIVGFGLVSHASAHHGGGVEWQSEIEGPVAGTATEFHFRFPHVVILMDVPKEGAVEKWAVTTRWTPTILRRHGWTRHSIARGDQIVITYLPHVSDPAVVHMQSIEVNGEALPLQF